jgi:predicted RNase H-related nuclease YkuK (DUF458 family)
MKKYKNKDNFNLEKIKEIIKNSSEKTKVYIGCDSVVLRNKKIRFATVVILHIDGKHGCKMYGKIEYDTTKDSNKAKPFNRMMMEVQKLTEMYTLLEEVLIDKDFEIHVDVNPNEKHGSNVAYGAAKGYIQSIVGIMPTFKPFAFAASCAADKFCR